MPHDPHPVTPEVAALRHRLKLSTNASAHLFALLIKADGWRYAKTLAVDMGCETVTVRSGAVRLMLDPPAPYIEGDGMRYRITPEGRFAARGQA